MKKLLHNILLGNAAVREYCTVTLEGEIKEKVYLITDGKSFDISETHWLLCLDPLVFGIWFKRKGDDSFERKSICEMHFMDSAVGETVAKLKMSFLTTIEEQDGTLLLLKLNDVSIRHIGFIKSRLLYYRYYKKPEQNFFKLKSYSAAYSYPRRVRLVSFKEGDWYNIFPMDLVGDIPDSRRYVFGLRHSNVTLDRIRESKKICVAEIPFEYKEIIYQLGKHHRAPLSLSNLPFPIINTETFGFPLPEWSNSYKEIGINRSMNLGSHMLLWGEEVNEKYLHNPQGHLFHIHFLLYLHQQQRGMDYRLV